MTIFRWYSRPHPSFFERWKLGGVFEYDCIDHESLQVRAFAYALEMCASTSVRWLSGSWEFKLVKVTI